MNKLLTPHQAAAVLGISHNTLAYWRWLEKRGEATPAQQLKCCRVGKLVRYHPDDLQAFAAKNAAAYNKKMEQ